MLDFHRRALLALSAALATFASFRIAAQPKAEEAVASAQISVDEFLRLSRELTGQTLLDRQLAATYLTALLALPGNVDALPRLAHGSKAKSKASAANAALEATLIEWWYTGIYVVDGQPRVATHDAALMWNALQRPAPGTCSGTFGAWAQPPRRGA